MEQLRRVAVHVSHERQEDMLRPDIFGEEINSLLSCRAQHHSGAGGKS